jgi:hypothetical protein
MGKKESGTKAATSLGALGVYDAMKHRDSALAVLDDVALIDGRQSAKAAGQSIAKWLDDVRRGVAPAPVIRRHRFTRWRAIDVRAHIEKLIADGRDSDTDAAMAQRTNGASQAAARRKRRGASASGTGQ